jgi:Transglycosylase
VRLDLRRTLIGLIVAGAAGVALLPFACYGAGTALGPPRPTPSKAQVPRVVADALWARADGGLATRLEPITPLSMFKTAACAAEAHVIDDGRPPLEREGDCRIYRPAMEGVELLSDAHVKAAHPQRGDFLNGISRFSTTIWLTHSFTKEEFLSTFAERGVFGFGFRGVEAAARGYFGRSAAELTVPQAALIAAMAGTRLTDPWCNPAGAAGRRHNVLVRMRDNAAIGEEKFQEADVSELGVGDPPATHRPCAG